MTRSFRSIAVACAALAIVAGSAGESLACGWGWGSPCGTTTYRPLFPFLTGYRGVAAGCCGTCSPCAACSPCGGCSTCAPQVSTCNSCYRVAYAPVVAYRPACGGCNTCGATTVLRPVVSYAPSYSTPVTTYAAPVVSGQVEHSYAAPAVSSPVIGVPSSGCSNCGAAVTRPGAPVVSRIVQPQAPAIVNNSPAASAPIVSSAPAGSYVPSSSYAPPGGSYTSASPNARTLAIPRPGPVEDQASSLELDANGPSLPQQSIPDVRTSSPRSKVLTRDESGEDRTTRLPSHRTVSARPAADESRMVIQTQHTEVRDAKPAKKKIDDGGWRPLK